MFNKHTVGRCVPFPQYIFHYNQLQTQGTYSQIKIQNMKNQIICNSNIYSFKSHVGKFNIIREKIQFEKWSGTNSPYTLL